MPRLDQFIQFLFDGLSKVDRHCPSFLLYRFVSCFKCISMKRSLIVWLFPNRSSCSLMIFSRLPSVSICRIIFVFLLPCRPISSLSSQSRPKSGCVFLFSVTRIGNTFLHFSVFKFHCSLTFEFDWVFIHVYKAFCGPSYLKWINYWRYYRYWKPVSIMKPIGWPWISSIAL